MVADVPRVAAYVISLARRTDRRARVPQLAARIGPGTLVIDAVDGQQVRPPEEWAASAQAWACKESHLRVLHAAPAGHPVLIVEDDADPPPWFPELLDDLLRRVPADWEAVMLGGEHRSRPEAVTPGVVRCVRTCRTHCYLLRGSGVEVARRAAARAVTHWDGQLALSLGRRGRTYAPEPFLVSTTGSPSSIPDSRPLPAGGVNLG